MQEDASLGQVMESAFGKFVPFIELDTTILAKCLETLSQTSANSRIPPSTRYAMLI